MRELRRKFWIAQTIIAAQGGAFCDAWAALAARRLRKLSEEV